MNVCSAGPLISSFGELKEKLELKMKKSSRGNSGANHGNTSNEIDILSDENDMSVIKRCQRKMSQTITSFHLSVPNVDRRNSNFLFKVGEKH